VQDPIAKLFASMSPHMRQLGFQIMSIDAGVCVASLPYSDELIGDPVTALGTPLPLATLDLRIDYLRPSSPGRAVIARVECYKTTHNIAFTRGVAYDVDDKDPVASMAATYMLRTQAVRGSERP
jgi:acyl-coenzyme A thioesterase PaaI-like protein